MKPYCITFAGALGSSKTPIATYLSYKLGLPIFSNDAIRSEVKEDTGAFDIERFEKLMKSRFDELMGSGRSFIYDVSVDRRWSETKPKLDGYGYEYFIISLDFSRDLLADIYRAKDYDLSVIEDYRSQHDKFLEQYGAEVGLSVTDDNFNDRLGKSLAAVETWLNGWTDKIEP